MLDTYKDEHFLYYLFTIGLMQDVAYGITKLKFDSGEIKIITHAILTAKFSHILYIFKDVVRVNLNICLKDNCLGCCKN